MFTAIWSTEILTVCVIWFTSSLSAMCWCKKKEKTRKHKTTYGITVMGRHAMYFTSFFLWKLFTIWLEICIIDWTPTLIGIYTKRLIHSYLGRLMIKMITVNRMYIFVPNNSSIKRMHRYNLMMNVISVYHDCRFKMHRYNLILNGISVYHGWLFSANG